MAKTNSSRKVIKYKRRPKAAVLIFAVILIYVVCFVVMYMSKSKVQTYEVDTGELTTNATFTGIALRSEQVYASAYSGNINYYQREGSRVKKGDTLYTVDETGRVAEILSQYTKAGENSLSAQSLASIKSSLNNFRTGYNGNNFYEIYDLKTDINGTVLEAINESVMQNLESIIESTGSQNLFQTVSAQQTGIVAYYLDGYESLMPNDITADSFNKSGYSKQILKSEELIVANSPAYKLITSEDWDIMIPLTQEDISAYDLNNKTSITIKIKKDNLTTNAGFSVINQDGRYYGKISLNKYVIRYASERFLDIELAASNKNGLKIPVSAITENEFFTIPKEYLTTGGNSNSYGFICEQYENGQLVTQFIAADIYKSTDTLVYVSKEEFSAGSSIVKTDSSERFVVGPTEKLKGVYCINTGYTVFKLVDIIDQNNEYCISRKGVSHGISVYDRIVLNAERYTVNQMIY